MHPFLSRLQRELAAAGDIPVATVVAVSTGVEALTIQYRGSVVPGVMFLDSYSDPQPGDRVVVQSYNGTLFVLGSLGAAQAAYGPNLAPNPGFELGTLGQPPASWTDFWGADAFQDDGQYLSGSRSGRLDPSGLTGASVTRLSMTAPVEVDPGTTYRVSAWFKAAALNPLLQYQIQVLSAPTPDGSDYFGPDNVTQTVSFSALTTEWTEVVGTRLIPAGHMFARVSVDLVSSATPGGTQAWVDEVSFRKQL